MFQCLQFELQDKLWPWHYIFLIADKHIGSYLKSHHQNLMQPHCVAPDIPQVQKQNKMCCLYFVNIAVTAQISAVAYSCQRLLYRVSLDVTLQFSAISQCEKVTKKYSSLVNIGYLPIQEQPVMYKASTLSIYLSCPFIIF